MKDRVAMKLFKDVKTLQDKITEMVNLLKPELIKSITGYELYTKPFLSNFKV
jgi:hypothetical protein